MAEIESNSFFTCGWAAPVGRWPDNAICMRKGRCRASSSTDRVLSVRCVLCGGLQQASRRTGCFYLIWNMYTLPVCISLLVLALAYSTLSE